MNLKQYLTEGRKAYSAFQVEQIAASAELEKERSRYAQIQRDPTKSKTAKAFAKENLRDAETKYRQTVADHRRATLAKFAELENAAGADSSSFLAVDPGKLDGNGVALLNAGILSVPELASMAGFYRENGVMLRMIAGVADGMHKGSGDLDALALASRIRVFLNPDARVNALHNGLYQLQQGLGEDQELTASIARTWENIAPGYESTLSALESFSAEG